MDVKNVLTNQSSSSWGLREVRDGKMVPLLIYVGTTNCCSNVGDAGEHICQLFSVPVVTDLLRRCSAHPIVIRTPSHHCLYSYLESLNCPIPHCPTAQASV